MLASHMDNPYQASVHTDFVTQGGAVSAPTIDALTRTKPWVRFCSVIGFIFTAIMILSGIGMTVSMSMIQIPQTAGVPGMSWLKYLGFLYIGLSIIYLIPSLKLWKYGSSIRNLIFSRSTTHLEAALEQHRIFWKFVSIMMIIGIVLFFIFVIVVVIAGIGAAAAMSPR